MPSWRCLAETADDVEDKRANGGGAVDDSLAARVCPTAHHARLIDPLPGRSTNSGYCGYWAELLCYFCIIGEQSLTLLGALDGLLDRTPFAFVFPDEKRAQDD